jgi:hypothetical protein
MIQFLKGKLGFNKLVNYLRIESEAAKLLTAKGVIHQMKQGYSKVKDFSEIEFSVFSQIGDDGIIQYLIDKIEIENKFFIEFGVQNYIESNTRFLLMNNYWSGLIYDGSKENIDFIKSDYYYWKYNLKARNLFITQENINESFLEDNVPSEPGILHIDIDGNDYWIWKSIKVIRPVIVIMEYNSGFGNKQPITVPYRADFERYSAHYSGLYFGASLQALCDLAEEKGYEFVGSSSYGLNAYFVRKDKIGDLKPLTCIEGFRNSFARQNKDKSGLHTYELDENLIKKLSGLKVYNTRSNEIENLLIE